MPETPSPGFDDDISKANRLSSAIAADAVAALTETFGHDLPPGTEALISDAEQFGINKGLPSITAEEVGSYLRSTPGVPDPYVVGDLLAEATRKVGTVISREEIMARELPPYTPSFDTTLAPEDSFFPINSDQVNRLLGKLLTHIDALGLPPGQAKANKDLIRQSLQQWFNEAKDNSRTSHRGCIAPIQLLRHRNGTERKYVWRAVGDHAVSVN